jgi:hypothetical protein
LITSYDESRRKSTEAIPGIQEKTEKIFQELQKSTPSEETHELVKTLKLASDAASYLDSGKQINLYSSGIYKIHTWLITS